MARRKQNNSPEGNVLTFASLIGFGGGMYLTRDFTFSLIIGGILVLIAAIIMYQNIQKKKKQLLASGIYEIDGMKGEQFEEYLKLLYQKMGYSVSTTPRSGDFGADLILHKDGQKIVVQVKRYSKSVGIKAVQEIIPAIRHYRASQAWVITNNKFTTPAMQLANSNNVRLIDRDELVQLILNMKHQEQIVSSK